MKPHPADNEPWQPLVDYVHELHLAAGRPSYREISVATGISHTHVGFLLKGTKFSSLAKLQALVDCLNGDVPHATTLWKTAMRAAAGPHIATATLDSMTSRLDEIAELLKATNSRLDRIVDLLEGPVAKQPPQPTRRRRAGSTSDTQPSRPQDLHHNDNR